MPTCTGVLVLSQKINVRSHLLGLAFLHIIISTRERDGEMDSCIIPSAHPDAWIDLLRGYTTAVVSELSRHGITVSRSWLDPGDPRDATILYNTDCGRDSHRYTHALVWDEVSGWRTGRFVSGEQGVRTVLSEPGYIGGGLLPAGAELAWKVKSGKTVAPRVLRSYADTHDGLDDALRNQARLLV